MRVGVDARHLRAYRGVSRYTFCLLDALTRDFARDQWLLFVPGNAPLAGLRVLGERENVFVRRHPLPSRALFGAAALLGRPRLDRLLGGALDVVWLPAPAPVAVSGALPLVLTVHDLSFELRPADFTAYERLWHRLARPCELARRAAAVVVPAPPTREELTRRWGLAPERVRVVPEGVHRPQAAPDAHALERVGVVAGGYLLVVGALEPRKAPLLLARAFAAARARGLRSELVFAGEGRLASALRAPGVHLAGMVNDAELEALYAGAVALVAPSLLEGYGLPVREALARGVPAIISDLPVYGEELSPGVRRFPPGDEGVLADALLEIEQDQLGRAEMAACAPAAVRTLSWTQAASETHSILTEAAAGAPTNSAR